MLISFLEDFVAALHEICPSWGQIFYELRVGLLQRPR